MNLRSHGHRWQLIYWADGKQQNDSWPRLPGETRRQAERRLAEDIARCLAGKRQRDRSGLTVGSLLTQWLRDYKPRAPQTRYLAEIAVDRVLKPALGSLVVARVRPIDLTNWKNSMLESGGRRGGPLKPATVARPVTVLRLAIRWAAAQKLMAGDQARDILDAVKPPKPDADDHAWTVIEPEALLRLREELLRLDYRGRPVVHMLDTGMRPCEVIGLKWARVKAEYLEVVEKGLRIAAKGMVFGGPKTKAGERKVGIPARLADVLDKQRSWQAFQHKRIGAEWKNSRGLVYTTDRGGPLDSRRLRESFDRARKAAGIPHCRLYDLRHSWVTMMLSLSGVPDSEISRQAGHRDVGFTHRAYGHGLEDAPRRIASAYEAVMSQIGAHEAENVTGA